VDEGELSSVASPNCSTKQEQSASHQPPRFRNRNLPADKVTPGPSQASEHLALLPANVGLRLPSKCYGFAIVRVVARIEAFGLCSSLFFCSGLDGTLVGLALCSAIGDDDRQ
jgi:hypothetical protein